MLNAHDLIPRMRLLLCSSLVLLLLASCQGAAVMSVDLGTEWMKVAVVSVSGILQLIFWILYRLSFSIIRHGSYPYPYLLLSPACLWKSP